MRMHNRISYPESHVKWLVCVWCMTKLWVDNKTREYNVACVITVRCSYEAVQPSHLQRHLETHQVQKRFACSHCDYSANTVSYLKIHQTRRHPPTSSSTPRVLAQLHSNGSGLECHICHYVFGNASDLKRHLRLRHGIDSSQPAISSTALVNNLSLTTISNLTAAC